MKTHYPQPPHCKDQVDLELDTGHVRTHMKCAVGKVDAVAISPNGEFAYSIYHDTLMAYDLNKTKQLAALTFDHQITTIAVTPDGNHIAVGDQSGCMHFLCLATQ